MWLELSLIVTVVTLSVLYAKLASPDAAVHVVHDSMAGIAYWEAQQLQSILQGECCGLSRKKLEMIQVCHVESISDDILGECIICKDEYRLGQALRVLQCQHRYHQDCVDSWFAKSAVCPLCRRDAV